MTTTNIFDATIVPTATSKANQLDLTPKLTTFAELKVNALIAEMSQTEAGQIELSECFESPDKLKAIVDAIDLQRYEPAVKAHKAIDARPAKGNKLAVEAKPAVEAKEAVEDELGFMFDIDNDEAIKMLKSQQSKVSRTRSKGHNKINLVVLMTASLAEHIIRITHQVTKGVRGAVGKSFTLTDAQYKELANDQIALGKAIRNVQSKKSTTKTRKDFDPNSAMWTEILAHETRLKDLRTTPGKSSSAKSEAVVVTDIFKVLKEMDPAERDALIANPDSSELLAKIHEVVDVETKPEPNAEPIADADADSVDGAEVTE